MEMAYSRDNKINKNNNVLRNTGKSFFNSNNQAYYKNNFKDNIGSNYPYKDNRIHPVKLIGNSSILNKENEKANNKNIFVEKKTNNNDLNYLDPDTAVMAQNFAKNYNQNNNDFFSPKQINNNDLSKVNYLNPDTDLITLNYVNNNNQNNNIFEPKKNNNDNFPEGIQNQNQSFYLNKESSKVTQKYADNYIKNKNKNNNVNLSQNRNTNSYDSIFFNNSIHLNRISINNINDGFHNNRYERVLGGHNNDNCDPIFYNFLKTRRMEQ